jgi:acyl-CoA reductase-like NAD-dependent aldehyde dehydrogenase
MQELKLWIGGQWVSPQSGKTFATYNPTTGEEIAKIPLAGQPEIEAAVAAARQAFPAWSGLRQMERSAMVRKIGDVIRQHAAELSELEILEHGTSFKDSKMMPMMAAGDMDYASSVARSFMGDVIPAINDTLTYLMRVPVGVAAIITPWNHALGMMAVKLGQALSVGNTCIIKPPSVNSLIGLKFAEVLEKADLPPGTVNIITGPGGTVGNALASHPDVDIIGFTGSSETGKDLMAAGSATIKRLIMELGGKNPVIVCEDADVDAAIEHHAARQFHNAGQHCSGAGRYYVHEKVHDEFVAKFIKVAEGITVGDPADEKNFMGPMANAQHRDRVYNYIQSGIDQGARLAFGGGKPPAPLDKGWFVMPTIFTGVRQDMTIARDEIFGPVAVIMEPFTSEDKVIELANDNRYGLCATVWTKDINKGLRFTKQLNAGTVSINTQTLTPELPWGGFKESGIGKEGSVEGIKGYTQLKMVCLKHG